MKNIKKVKPKFLSYKNLFLFLIIFGGFLFFSGEAMAATIYVKDISNTVYYESGASSCDDVTSEDTPSDIDDAILHVFENGTVYLCPGTYSLTEIDSSDGVDITTYNGVTIEGVGDASGVIVDGTGLGDHIFRYTKENITFKNFTIRGTDDTYAGVFRNGGENINIENMIFEDNWKHFNIVTATGIANIKNNIFRRGISPGSFDSIIGRDDDEPDASIVVNFNFNRVEDNIGWFSFKECGTLNILNNQIIGNVRKIFRFDTWDAGTINVKNNQFIANGSSSSNEDYIDEINNNATMNWTNNLALPRGDFHGLDCGIAELDSNNCATCIYESPRYIQTRRQGYISLHIDDGRNEDVFLTLIDSANPYGIKFNYALHGYLNDGVDFNWDELSSAISAGNEISDHGRWGSSSMTNMTAVTLSTTATNPDIVISIDDSSADSGEWTGTLVATDDEGLNTTITLQAVTTNIITKLVIAINALDHDGVTYTATGGNQPSSVCLDDVTLTNFSGEQTLLYNRDRLYYVNFAEHKKWIEDNLGSMVRTYIVYGNHTNETFQDWMKDDDNFDGTNFRDSGTTAFDGGRGNSGGSWTLNDADDVSGYTSGIDSAPGLQIYEILTKEADTYFGTANIKRNTQGLAELLGYRGEITTVNGHEFELSPPTGYTKADWQTVFAALAETNLQFVTMSNIIDLAKTGTDIDGDGERWTLVTSNNPNYQLRATSPAIDTGTSTSLTTDFAGNSIYGVPDIGIYEYQPPYTIGTHDILTTGSIRIYSDGKYRMKTASSTSATTTFSITPASGSYFSTTTQYMDITIDSWLTTGTKNKQWTATSTSGDFLTKATSTIYTIGDLKANTYYQFKLDNTASTTAITNNSFCTDGVCKSDENGQIIFTYVGGYSTHTFGLEEDTIPPVAFSLSSPANASSTVDTQPTLTWNASSDAESGLAKYQLWINDILNKDNIATTTTSATSTTALSDGNYTWKIVAFDNAGNSATSTETWTIRIDTTAPTGSITNGSGNPTNKTTPTLALTIADTGVGITNAQMRFSCDNSTFSTWENYATPKTDFNIRTGAGCTDEDGDKTVYIQFRDSLSNESISYNTGSFTLDTVSSFATFDSGEPTNPTNQNSTDITVAGTDITHYEYKLDDGTYSDETAITSHLTLSDLTDGEHTIYLRGKDSSDNWQTKESATEYIWTVDVTSPIVSLSSPSNNSSTGNSTPTLTWSGSDATSGIANYQLYIDDNLDTNNISGTSATPSNALSCGNHTWYVKATDNAGNSTNSETFNLTRSCGGGIPIWMLNQINQNQNQDQNSDDTTDNNQDQNTENNNSDKTIVEKIKQKVFSYSRSRLKSLFQEQDSAKDLKSELEKHYGENKIPVHKKHWHTIVNSYIYGNYPIQAIIQAIKFGGKTVHPTIPFSAWQKAGDYLGWIGR